MQKLRIGCIINPHSGVKRIKELQQEILNGINHELFSIKFFETTKRKHATILSKQILEEKHDILLICGGDGTINEALQSVINSDILVGIIPTGSGNGLSMHTGIGREYLKAIDIINKLNWKHIDAIQFGEKYFINLAGIGFDGFLSKKIRNRKYRGFWIYVWLFIRYFWNYKTRKYTIITDSETIEGYFNLIEIANGPMYGYNFEVVPGADISDGIIDILLLEKTSIFRILLDSVKLLRNEWDKISWAKRLKTTAISVSSNRKLQIHVDGEYVKLKSKDINLSILPKAIKLIIP